ncbi:hypothetical protein ACPA0F_18665 [Solibacillus silvestris]
MNEHKSVRNNVKVLVQQFPELAESYTKLNIAYWSIYDNCEKITDLQKATPAETIRRNFQKLVEQGILPVPQRIQRLRKEKEREFVSEFSALG